MRRYQGRFTSVNIQDQFEFFASRNSQNVTKQGYKYLRNCS